MKIITASSNFSSAIRKIKRIERKARLLLEELKVAYRQIPVGERKAKRRKPRWSKRTSVWWCRSPRNPSPATPIGDEEDLHLGDFIENKTAVSPNEAVMGMNLAEQIRRVLATLTPREEKVLRMRFGIGEKSDHTPEEVDQDFEVTREHIRQIEAKALRKLRHPSRAKRLKAFVEG